MKTANDFLKEKGIIKEGYSKWICKFEDGSEFDIGGLMQAYADQQVLNYKTQLRKEVSHLLVITGSTQYFKVIQLIEEN